LASKNNTRISTGIKILPQCRKNTNTKPICNAPIGPSKKPESEARKATVTGSDLINMPVKDDDLAEN